jgi:plastocyanin
LASFSLDGNCVKRSLLVAVAVSAVLGRPLAPAQVIQGRVDLPRARDDQIMTARYQVGGDTKLGMPEQPVAVVYLEGDFSQAELKRSAAATEMEQKNMSFSPGVLPIQVGTTVEFPNLDDMYHNVFSYSKAKRFDLGRYRKGEKAAAVVFDKPGTVTLHCEIHASMRATILVLDTPYFAKTNGDGTFHLGGLPTGRYLLKAWVSDADIRVQPVELKPGATLQIDFARK